MTWRRTFAVLATLVASCSSTPSVTPPSPEVLAEQRAQADQEAKWLASWMEDERRAKEKAQADLARVVSETKEREERAARAAEERARSAEQARAELQAAHAREEDEARARKEKEEEAAAKVREEATAATRHEDAASSGARDAVATGRKPEPAVEVAQPPDPPPVLASRTVDPPVVPASLPVEPVAASSSDAPAPSNSAGDGDRLSALVRERASIRPEEAYRIGAGDLLEINVFDLPEMNRKVRVSSSGFVQLPLIGAVKASTRSEADLAAEISKRLAVKYVRDPQVDVFVEEYKSQQVGVMGSVAKPGLIPLTKNRYTVLDMISEAGGLTKDAGAVVQVIPATRGARSPAMQASTAGAELPSEESARGVTMDLADLMRGDHSGLNLRVVPGDVIFVPEAGSFTIEGWVDKPGTYPLSRNMTVLAALSAGGGSLMPSKLRSVEILRAKRGAQAARDIQVVDLNAIRDGTVPDVELRSGDIVRVPGYKTLMVPWGVYSFFKSLISIGASFPIL